MIDELKVEDLKDDGLNEGMFLSDFNEHMYRFRRFHRDKTRFFVHGKYVVHSAESLFIFGIDSKLRYKILKIVISPFFDRFIISLILIYSILLGMKCYDVTIENSEDHFANKLLN